MFKFKIISGSYFEDGQLYHVGEVVPSDKALDTIFMGRFHRLSGSPVLGPVETSKDTPDKVVPITSNPTGKGELVDGLFKYSPEGTGLHVYKRGTKFFVYDIDSLAEPLNEKGLTKPKVIPFIKSQCEE